MGGALVETMNVTLASGDRDRVVRQLSRCSNLAEAAERAGLEMSAVERQFLADLPEEVFAAIKAALTTALKAGRKVSVDWAPGFAPEVSISVSPQRASKDMTLIVRTPRPKPVRAATRRPSR